MCEHLDVAATQAGLGFGHHGIDGCRTATTHQRGRTRTGLPSTAGAAERPGTAAPGPGFLIDVNPMPPVARVQPRASESTPSSVSGTFGSTKSRHLDTRWIGTAVIGGLGWR